MTGELFFVGLIRALAGIVWLALLVFIGYAFVRRTRNNPVRHFSLALFLIVIAAIIINIMAAGLVVIQPDERGVIVAAASGGVRPIALEPGLKWVIPYAEKVVLYSISRNTYTMSIAPQEGQIVGDDSVEARTLDGQIVLVDASVIFSVIPTRVVDIHIRWQDRYVDGLVRPLARGAIRDAASRFSSLEIGREVSLIEDVVSEVLQAAYQEEGLLLVDFVVLEIFMSSE